MVVTGKMAKQYLEANTALLQLLDSEEYELLLSVVEDKYRGYILTALYDCGYLDGKMSYSVYQAQDSKKTMLLPEGQLTKLTDWANKNIGADYYWYITNDLTGEIIYINDET